MCFYLLSIRSLQLPTVIAMIDHLAGHATIDTDTLTRDNTAFCCRIALRLRLAHAVSRRRDVHNGSSRHDGYFILEIFINCSFCRVT